MIFKINEKKENIETKKRELLERKIERIETIKKTTISSLLIICGLVLILIFFAMAEEYQLLVAGSEADSVIISVVVSETISISSPSDISLSPEIAESGSSTGNVTWNVETNDSDGWELELNASTSSALTKGADSFTDYTEAVAGVPESWSVDVGASEFGFSTTGSYAEAKYSSGTLFEGFEGATGILVAQDDEATPGGGADAQVNFRAEVGTSKSQPVGTYTATITATATTL